MGILAVHITTAKIREKPVNKVALGHLGPGQIGVGWVPQNDVTMEAVRADDYFPTPPVVVCQCIWVPVRERVVVCCLVEGKCDRMSGSPHAHSSTTGNSGGESE